MRWRAWERGFARPIEGQISPEAEIDSTARIDGNSSIGPGAKIGPGCVVEQSAIWENAILESGTKLKRCIVREGRTVTGDHESKDF